MFGNDPIPPRSRYDYYYSCSSPSQSTSYYETQASLFGEPVPPLLPGPLCRSPSPHRILTPLTPFNTHHGSPPSTAATNYEGPRPLLETFDNHLYESFRKNFVDKHHNKVTEALNRHEIWTTHNHNQNHYSSSISPRDDVDSDDVDMDRRRVQTPYARYNTESELMQNKYRSSMSANVSGSYNTCHQDSTEVASIDSLDNVQPRTVFYLNNKPDNIVRLETTSNSTSSCSKPLFSRFNRSKSVSRIPLMRKKPVAPSTATTKRGLTSLSLQRPRKKTATVAPSSKPPPLPRVASLTRASVLRAPPIPRTIRSLCSKATRKPPLPPVKLVKSKTEHTLKTYPEAFTVLPSPKKSPSAGCLTTKRRRSSEYDEEGDGWIKPPIEKMMDFVTPREEDVVIEMECNDCELVEFNEPMGEEEEDNEELKNRKYNIDQFGQKVSMPTTPIITDRVKTGSKNRVPDGSFNSHKKIAFAVINDNRTSKMRADDKYYSEEDLTGRMSPYSRYIMQRELSMPALNRIESLEKESDDGEFFYVVDEKYDEEGGRKTSIGFAHSRKPMSASMSEITEIKRPKSEMKKRTHYASSPNFVRLNKDAVTARIPVEKSKPRVIFHRCLRGILKVYDNTNVTTTKRQYSLDNMDLFLPNGKLDPDLLAPMAIRNNHRRSRLMDKQQEKYRRMREKMMRKRRLSPIEGTPRKDPLPEFFSPKRKTTTPKDRLDARLKTDKFGRLITPRKPSLPDFRNRRRKKHHDDEYDDEVRLPEDPDDKKRQEDEDLSKAMNFLAEVNAKNVLKNVFAKKSATKDKPPLNKQGSKMSLISGTSTGTIDPNKPALVKKGSMSSLSIVSVRSVSKSIKSFKSGLSSRTSIDDEEAEKKDKIGALSGSAKSRGPFMRKAKGIQMTNRLGSGLASKRAPEKKEGSNPPPSRTNSKASLRSGSRANLREPKGDSASSITPSKKSEPIRVPSASSIMSMTTAAITSNPLNTTLIVTNQLASHDVTRSPAPVPKNTTPLEKVREEIAAAPSPVAVAASSQDADKVSMASQKTNNSRSSAKGSRKQSARSGSRKSSAAADRRKSSVLGTVASLKAVRLFKKKSPNVSDNELDDDQQITKGEGSGADNKSSAGRNMRKEMSKTSLRSDHDANNNSLGHMSRTSTAADMKAAAAGSVSRMESVSHMSTGQGSMKGEQMNVNEITVKSATPANGNNEEDMADDEDDEDDDSQYTSSSTESRKRGFCCGLSSCCRKGESGDEEETMAKENMTCMEKVKTCSCWPFSACKRKKVADGMNKMDMQDGKESWWRRMCCCSNCCKKSDVERGGMKQSTMEKKSCWSRLNCFKSCSSCCGRSDSESHLQPKDNDSPSTCTRIFCFCCLCCRGKPESETSSLKRPSQASQQGNCCSRMCNALLCCRRKKKNPRRRSMLSKKQSLAPTIPPPEEQKPKLDMVLVEHASLMKGAIPVLPVYLAYFCLVFNVITPGLGTFFSGLFCLCIGVPRFSQHDGARGRIGSFIINTIVGISQAFTIIFCFVGWGWSIWWGTIMLNVAKKRRRIRRAEKLREEDEFMKQKEELPGMGAKSKDVEKGII